MNIYMQQAGFETQTPRNRPLSPEHARFAIVILRDESP